MATPDIVVPRSGTFTTDTRKAIVEATLNGSSVEDAADSQGIDRSTIFRWQKRGREALAVVDAGGAITAEDELYATFAFELHTARSRAKVEAEMILRQFMLGVAEEETVTTRELNAQGELVVTKEVTKARKRRDLRAVLEWLRARFPKEYGTLGALALVGADGSPVEIAERAQSLADEAEAYAHGHADALEAQEVTPELPAAEWAPPESWGPAETE